MQPISICVIAKNEEKHMDTFLSRIMQYTKGYPIEIVIADTGSTDATKDIIAKYPVKLLDFPWINDFSAARNFTIDNASNDWILVLDCDEYIEELDMEVLQQFMQAVPKTVGLICIHSHFPTGEVDSISDDYIERFFNRKYYHYEDVIHEHIYARDGSSYKRMVVPVAVDHSGYNGTPEELAAKVARNNALLLEMLEKDPDNPYLYFQLGQSANMLHDYETAYYYYGKGLEFDLDPNVLYVQMMVCSYGYALLALERYDEAMLFENIYDEFATNADFVFLMGLIYLRTGNFVKAMAQFLKATTYETSRVKGVNSYIATYNMGVINEVLGDIKTAISLYEKSGDFPPAKERLKLLAAPKP